MTLSDLLKEYDNKKLFTHATSNYNTSNYDFSITRDKNRFKEDNYNNNYSEGKTLSDVEVERIKKNRSKQISNDKFNLNVEINKTEELNSKNISFYNEYSRISEFGIGSNSHDYLLINDEMTDETMDVLLNEIGNKNVSKRKILRKKNSDNIYDFTFKNSTIEQQLILTETNFVIHGYNKNDNNVFQRKVSYNKNDKDYIRNFSHLTYNGNIYVRKPLQFDLANKLDNCIFNRETKQEYFDFLTNNGLCSVNYANTLLNNNDKDTIKKILKTKKIRFNTGYSKVITIDCDYENNLEGSIKKDFIFHILRNFKYVIIENKNIFKNNHFTICILLSTFREMNFISRIRDMFKIAGICDPGHQTPFGKNMFNTELYNIYYNKYGKYLDDNFDEFIQGVVGDCCNINEDWLKKLGIYFDNDVSNMLHQMSLLNNKVKNNVKLNLIDFTKSNEFIEYANNRKLSFKIKKLNNIAIGIDEDKKPESIGFNELCNDLKNQKIKSIEDFYNRTIIFQEDSRKRNCKKFGYMLGSYFKLNLSLKDVINIFNKIVKVYYNNEEKHKDLIDNVIKGYNTRNKKIHIDDNGKTYDNFQIFTGNVVTNSRSTMKTMHRIIKNIIELKNENKSIITIKKKLKKEHKRYNSFIDDITDTIYYTDIKELNKIIYDYTFKWLYKHTLEYGFENFKMNNDGQICNYILDYENEFVKFYNTYIINELTKIKPKKEKITFDVILKLFKPIKNMFTFDTLYYLKT